MTDNQKIFLVAAIAITGVGILAYRSGRKSATINTSRATLTGASDNPAIIAAVDNTEIPPPPKNQFNGAWYWNGREWQAIDATTMQTPSMPNAIGSGQSIMTNDQWKTLLDTKPPAVIANYNLLANNYIQGNPTLKSNWSMYESTGKVTAGVNDYKMILFALNNGFILPI